MRLIDADKFRGKVIASHCYSGVIKLINIDDVPTAFDVDKVVEQLEDLKSQVPVNRILDNIIKDKPKELGMLIAYDKAIETVKAGGLNDRYNTSMTDIDIKEKFEEIEL